MNDFDDLFDKESKQADPEAEKKVEDYYETLNLQRRNALMAAIYILSIIVFTFAAQLFIQLKYKDTAEIISNIVIVNEPQVTIDETGGSLHAYEITVTGILRNDTGFDLPEVYLEVVFVDDLGEEYTAVFTEKNILQGNCASFYETIYSDFNPVSYTISKGFDVSAMFYTLANLLPVFLSAMLFIYFDKNSFKYDFKRFKANWQSHLAKIVGGYFLVLGVLFLTSYILQILGVTDTSQNELTIRSMFEQDALQIFFLFMLLCVCTPIVEEVVFRKVIYNFVEPRTNKVIAIIVTGAVFGLMHVISYGDFIQALPYIGMGFVFGYIYFWSEKNIWVTIGVHVINNGVSFFIYVLATYGLYNLSM